MRATFSTYGNDRARPLQVPLTAGWRCHRLLWWTVHEPDAEELQPDKVLQDRFDQGRQVGEVARTAFPGGVLVTAPHWAREERVARTRVAVAAGAPAVFEASFLTSGVFVALDVLERLEHGYGLIEVKASTSRKDEHNPGRGRAGARGRGVRRAHPAGRGDAPEQGVPASGAGKSARADVTEPARALLAGIPAALGGQLAVLEGPLPEVPVGLHCFEPWECPFRERCWPASRDHIHHLTGVGPKTVVK